METLVINGVELEVNFNDADFLEPFEEASEELVKRAEELRGYKGKRYADGIRKTCEAVNEFFDKVFGEGTSDKLFNGNSDMKDHLLALDACMDASNDSQRDINNIMNKYVQRQKGQLNRGKH